MSALPAIISGVVSGVVCGVIGYRAASFRYSSRNTTNRNHIKSGGSTSVVGHNQATSRVTGDVTINVKTWRPRRRRAERKPSDSAELVLDRDPKTPRRRRLHNSGRATAYSIRWRALDRVGNVRFKERNAADLPPEGTMYITGCNENITHLEIVYKEQADSPSDIRRRWNIES
jgi:hypothetical protein